MPCLMAGRDLVTRAGILGHAYVLVTKYRCTRPQRAVPLERARIRLALPCRSGEAATRVQLPTQSFA